MPDRNRSLKQKAAFALAIIKRRVLSSRAESSKIEAALQRLFPGVSVILVAEDDEAVNDRRPQQLSDFAESSTCKVIASSKIVPN